MMSLFYTCIIRIFMLNSQAADDIMILMEKHPEPAYRFSNEAEFRIIIPRVYNITGGGFYYDFFTRTAGIRTASGRI